MRLSRSCVSAVFIAFGIAAAPHVAAAAPNDVAALVDPLVGTSGNGFDGATDTFPGADAPFGMVQWSPDTPSRAAGGGYYYGDSAITGFTMTHLSGPGCSVFGDVGFLPTIGGVVDPADASQAFSHASESAEPGYYSVIVGMPGIGVRLTVTPRTGLASFTFPPTRMANVIVNPSSDQAGVTDADIEIAGDREITGYATSGNFCGMPGTYTVYFAARFDRPFVAHGTWLLKELTPGAARASGPGAGAWLTFDTRDNPVVEAQSALSFVSVDGARANLRAEATTWDVDAERRATSAAWSRELARVEVAGGTATQRRIFYTALYHTMLHPNVYSDANGLYRGFDEQIHRVRAGHVEYATFSGWDIYRTLVPLLAVLEPARTSDMMQSLVDASAQMGWLPKWALANAETGVMGGDPSDPMLAGAYAFGARDFDAKAALNAMLKGATTTGGARGQGWYYPRPGLGEYQDLGYVTNDHTTNVSPVPNGASLTLEYALDDFSIAQLARALGDDRDYRGMIARAQNWSNLFDRSTGWIAPRDAAGAFLQTPVGDNGQSGFQEGTSAQYTWMVPQNMAALIDAMGGRAAAEAKLDAYFASIDGNGPNAWMGNEPSIGSPWAYLFTGQPWKAQRVVHDVMTQLWGDTPDGIPGNDDLGTMSAWYVWCAMGLYPQNPAAPVFDIGTPAFSRIAVRVPGGASIDIDAPGASPERPYVRSVTVDGRSSSKSWVPFAQSRPLHLRFTVDAAPNVAWASAPGAEPPSYAPGPVRFPPSTLASLGAPEPGALTLAPGASGAVRIALTDAGAAPAAIAWHVLAPAGIHASPSSGSATAAPGTNSPLELMLGADASAPSGLYDVVVSAASDNGATLAPVTASVRVARAGDRTRFVYVADYAANTVTPVDPRTNAYGAPIAVGKAPRAVLVSADGTRLYVADESTGDVTAVDTRTLAASETVHVGGAPYALGMSRDGATLWVAIHGDDAIVPVDVATLRAGSAVAVGKGPEEMAFSPDGTTIYVADQTDNDVSVVDTRTRKTIATIPTGVRPRSLAIAPDGKTLYVDNQGSGTISVIDVASGRQLAAIPAGMSPRRVVIAPDGRRLYVADTGSDTVTPIDTATMRALDPIVVGMNPYALAIDPSGSALYVVLGGDQRCVAVDVRTGAVGRAIATGAFPLAVAL